MAETSPADGAADRPVPQYILGQANLDCPTCVTVLTRSQKRYREKMEAIREKERLEQHMNQVEFSFQNHRLQAERQIKQLKQRLENVISLEDHNMKDAVTEKCDEYQAMLQQMTADTERAYANEKETLLAQLVNKKNELDSDKKHKDLLVKKITELQTELNNCKKEKSKDEQAKSHRQEEVITKLQAAIKTRDEEIAWLKTQMKQREEEHRQAISPRKDLINRQQTTTPSSQHRAAPNKILYR
ncbi:hypothetical protein SLS60_011092 [Paraconiothyrium brasiliense]|uniref:Uncharacterized protein n=1 Tax=Paraconiothyrium brasiliense TaxID=300254 RepID=A0ABR3QKK2_9PLEO